LSFFQKILQIAAPLMSAVQSLFSYVIILSVFGYFLDHRLDTFPLLFLITLFLGLIIGFYQLSRAANLKKKF
jgi:F0F1-type ATP synthase assembly protein I|tara:strand:- start:2073 stop:2288 length:216 start_codon:yes stop_codon:yes gene_type:complete